MSVRVKAAVGPAEARIIVGDQVRTVMIPQNTWSEIELDAIALTQGTNRLKWLVTSGVADLDWLELSPAEKKQQAASRSSTVLVR